METDIAALGSAHILVVEDDAGTRTLLLRFLEENGFQATGARNGAEMWDVLERLGADLILLDVMLPGSTGLDLCREVRRRGPVPIIMVTARGSETDRVLGLELGADDYVPKPFSRAELLARIRAVLRRGRTLGQAGGAPRSRYARFAGWRLDTGRRELAAPGGESVFEAADYQAVWCGQRSWNGVAILARGAEPVLTRTERCRATPTTGKARYIEAAVQRRA